MSTVGKKRRANRAIRYQQLLITARLLGMKLHYLESYVSFKPTPFRIKALAQEIEALRI